MFCYFLLLLSISYVWESLCFFFISEGYSRARMEWNKEQDKEQGHKGT